MPESAIDSGCVDLVLSPEEIALAKEIAASKQQYIRSLYALHPVRAHAIKELRDAQAKGKTLVRLVEESKSYKLSKEQKRLVEELRENGGDVGAVIGDPIPEAGAWVRVNPMDGDGAKDTATPRAPGQSWGSSAATPEPAEAG